MTFNYTASKKDAIHVYQLQGELIDRNQASTMLDEISGLAENNVSRVLLNMQDLRYINSSGLNILINILTRTRKNGGDVAICCVNKKISELLLITKLNSVFNVCDDENAAMDVLSK